MKRFRRCCLLVFAMCFLFLGEAAAVNITAPILRSVSNTPDGITLKWSAVKNAKGYYIYRKSGSEKYKKLATMKGKAKTSFTDKKVTYKKAYTYCVKAFANSATSKASVGKKVKRTAPAYAAAYAKALSKRTGSSDSLYYTLAYIDSDQVPELVIWDAQHVEKGYEFYQYIKGKVKKAGTFYSKGSYYIEYKRKKNLIYTWFYDEKNGLEEKQYHIYKLTSGKLKKLYLLTECGENGTINGKNVSASEVEKKIQKLLYNNSSDIYMIGHKKRIEDNNSILIGYDIDGVKVCDAGIKQLISDYKSTLSENLQIPED